MVRKCTYRFELAKKAQHLLTIFERYNPDNKYLTVYWHRNSFVKSVLIQVFGIQEQIGLLIHIYIAGLRLPGTG